MGIEDTFDAETTKILDGLADDEVHRCLLRVIAPAYKVPDALKVSDFPSRKDYRQALIDLKAEHAKTHYLPIVEELEQLSGTEFLNRTDMSSTYIVDLTKDQAYALAKHEKVDYIIADREFDDLTC